MKLNNLRKYFFPNLLSLIGYPIFLIFMYLLLIFTPKDWANVAEYAQDPEMTGFLSSAYMTILIVISFFIILTFVVLTLLEFLIRKYNKTEFSLLSRLPKRFKLPYTVFFWLGLILVSSPLLEIIYIEIEPLLRLVL